jgi:hypothetical protein
MYLEAKARANAITIAVVEEIPARRAFPSPRRFPMLVGRSSDEEHSSKQPRTARRSLHPAQKVPGRLSRQKQGVQIEWPVQEAPVYGDIIDDVKRNRKKGSYKEAARATSSQAHHSVAVWPMISLC